MSFDPFSPLDPYHKKEPNTDNDDPFKEAFGPPEPQQQQESYNPFAPTTLVPDNDTEYDPFATATNFIENNNNNNDKMPDNDSLEKEVKDLSIHEKREEFAPKEEEDMSEKDPVLEIIQNLSLAEKIILSSEKLNTATSLFLEIQPCVVAASMVDLILSGKVKLSNFSKDGVLVVKDNTATKDPIRDEMLKHIIDASKNGKTKTAEQWLLNFAGKTFTRKREIKSIIKRTIKSLEKKGLVTFEKPSLGGEQFRPSKLGNQINNQLWKEIKEEGSRFTTLKGFLFYLIYAAMPLDNEKTVLNLTKSEHDWRKNWKKQLSFLDKSAQTEMLKGVIAGLSLSVRSF